MSLVAEFIIPAQALPFGDTLAAMPNMRLEIERIVPTKESAFPFFWIRGSDPETFLERAQNESGVHEIMLLDRMDDRALFRAEWSPDTQLVRGIKELDGTIIESVATSDHWRFEVRAQHRDAFARFHQVFHDDGITVELNRLCDLSELIEDDQRPLTPQQRETLLTAYQNGYFEKPRDITQEELGEQFDISHRAISDRIRRGTRNLVAATLLPDADTS